MSPTLKILIKFIALVVISPLVGYLTLQIFENLKKAKAQSGSKKWLSLGIAGFLIAVLLGWLQ